MSLKENILRLLSDSHNKYISGESMAESYNVSRNAVWKAVNSLRKQGYNINAVQNKGYILEGPLFTAEEIKKYINSPLDIKYISSVTSTNDVVMELGKNNEKEGIVIVSNHQSAGRGRKGRVFYSPKDTGVYFSILLRPNIHFSKALFITTAAAVSVCKACEILYNIKPDIKWVNDVYINNKKICGILTEAHIDMESMTIDYAALGIGINVFTPVDDFPENISATAGAAFHKDDYNDNIKSQLTAKVLDIFWENYKELESALFFQDYIDRSLITGKYVFIEQNGEKEKAFVKEINKDFKLCVQYENGREEIIDSGEVSIIL